MTRFSIYRPARDAPALSNVLKTSCQIVLFWSTFLVVIPLAILRLESVVNLDGYRFANLPTQVVGVVMFSGFSLLGLLSGYVMSAAGRGTPLPMDCARRLVTSGPYAVVRNPMAVAGIGQGIAVGIILGSPAVIAYALAGAVLWHHWVRPSEEQNLEERFGAEYQHYRSVVGLWWPRGYW